MQPEERDDVEELELTEDELAQAARAALRSHTAVRPEGIDIQVDHGTVTLSGFVGDRAQRREAGRAVARVSGVRAVTNAIKVVALQVSHGTLHAKVAAALVRHATREADQITLEIHGGTVTVSGAVESEVARRIVLAAIAGTRGVESVIDRLSSAA